MLDFGFLYSEERSWMRVYLLLFFFIGDCIETIDLEGWGSSPLNENQKLKEPSGYRLEIPKQPNDLKLYTELPSFRGSRAAQGHSSLISHAVHIK